MTRIDFLKENAMTAEQLKADTVKMLQWAGFIRQQIKEAERLASEFKSRHSQNPQP